MICSYVNEYKKHENPYLETKQYLMEYINTVILFYITILDMDFCNLKPLDF